MNNSNLKKNSKFIALHAIHFQSTLRLSFNLQFNSLTMLMSSSSIVTLSQNSNHSLKSSSTMTKNIKEFRRQIENKMQALLNQSLQCLNKIREMLMMRENVQKMTLKYM